MNWQALVDPHVSGRLCLTLFHSIWQVALLAAIAEPAHRRELSYLSSNYAAVSDDDRIAIVSLDLASKHVAARQSLDWNHGIISVWNDAEILNDFGFSYHVQEQLPMTVLVDPDGRIIENRLRGERIQAAVKSSISCQ